MLSTESGHLRYHVTSAQVFPGNKDNAAMRSWRSLEILTTRLLSLHLSATCLSPHPGCHQRQDQKFVMAWGFYQGFKGNVQVQCPQFRAENININYIGLILLAFSQFGVFNKGKKQTKNRSIARPVWSFEKIYNLCLRSWSSFFHKLWFCDVVPLWCSKRLDDIVWWSCVSSVGINIHSWLL